MYTRHEYITLDRLIKCGGSPSCRACETALLSGRHAPACRARFDALVRADRVGRTPRAPAAFTPVPEAEAPSTPMPVLDGPVEALPDADPSELPFSAGIPPGHPETEMPAKTNTEFDEIFLRNRRKYRRMYINHQVLIPSFYTHVMKTRPLVEFVMK